MPTERLPHEFPELVDAVAAAQHDLQRQLDSTRMNLQGTPTWEGLPEEVRERRRQEAARILKGRVSRLVHGHGHEAGRAEMLAEVRAYLRGTIRDRARERDVAIRDQDRLHLSYLVMGQKEALIALATLDKDASRG